LEIIWTTLARARLQEIRAFVAADKPDAAERLAIRIVTLIEALRDNPHLGRVSVEPGLRELIVGGSPYIVLYRIQKRRIVITTIWHFAQQRGL
jgi:plasmid stabilization system protein ParE